MSENKTDAVVIQKAISIYFECPTCYWDNYINYDEFCNMFGEPCDWNGRNKEIYCECCENKINIDCVVCN